MVDLDLPGDGVRLAATRWPGAGPTIVLLHGLASQRRFWNLVAARLVGRDLLALDLRGHGESDQPPAGYDLTTVAADVWSALAAADVQRPVLVGHSWGAAVALTAASCPDREVTAVVAIDGGLRSPADHGGDRAELRRRMQPPRLAVPPAELEPMLRRGSLARWWSANVAAALLPTFEVGTDGLARSRLPFELHMKVVDGLLDYRADEVLARVRAPVWAVACQPLDAEPDPGREEAVQARVRLLAQPRLLRWLGAVHDVPLQWPALVAGLIGAAVDEAGTPVPPEEV